MVATSVHPPATIPLGAPVYDRRGARVGRVCGADTWDLLIERGPIPRRTCAVSLEDVERVEEDRVILAVSKDEAIDA
jgi:uncharacterized protein YrrD